MKLQESENRFFITVPKKMIKKLKWKKGKEIFFRFNKEKNIEMHD